MTTTPAFPPASSRPNWRDPFEAWLKGLDGGWSLSLTLALFVAIWFLALVLAYSNAGLHPDTMEAWSLGREFAWGNPKHPPLMGWIARLWTSVFPLKDWSFQLLAMVNAAAALWIIDLITRRFVAANKRATILCLVLLLPTYHFHAQRFNANTVLLPLWPLATYCFIRSFEARTAVWAIAAGIACGIAVLGKYYSVFLVSSFVAAAILHPDRRSYLLSPAPWLSVVAGLSVLAPHLWWVTTHDYGTLNFALSQHGNNTLGETLGSAFYFLSGAAAYLALPVLIWIAASGRHWREIIPDLRSMNPAVRLLTLIFVGTLIFPIIAALKFENKLTPLWSLAGLFIPILVLVTSSRFTIERTATIRILAGIVVFHIVVLTFAPLHASYRTNRPHDMSRNIMAPMTGEVMKHWRSITSDPVKIVSGDDELALALAFYGDHHPIFQRAYDQDYTWIVPSKDSLPAGWIGLCVPYDPNCLNWLDKVASLIPPDKRIDVKFDVGQIRAVMVRPL